MNVGTGVRTGDLRNPCKGARLKQRAKHQTRNLGIRELIIILPLSLRINYFFIFVAQKQLTPFLA